MRCRASLPLLAVPIALAASLVLVPPTRAQHGMASGPPPLHLRLAGADVVAIATVEEVGAGRVTVGDAVVLRGEAPARFELKRAPSKQIPYAVGVSLVLPLAGARSPYLLLDDSRELISLRDPAAVSAWREGLTTLLAAGDDREALADTYLAWLDGADDSLRDAAGAALLDPRAQVAPLSPERASARARAALDPELPVAAQRVSALLATGRAEGAAALLAALPDPAADPQVMETALRGAVQWHLAGADEALVRALENANPAVRRAAIKLIESSASAPGLARLPGLAAHDADEGVRREATKVMSARGAPPAANPTGE